MYFIFKKRINKICLGFSRSGTDDTVDAVKSDSAEELIDQGQEKDRSRMTQSSPTSRAEENNPSPTGQS